MIASLIWLLLPLLYAVGALGVGTAFVSNETLAWHAINLLSGCLLPVRSVYFIVLNIKSGNRISVPSLFQALTETILALAIVFLPHLSYQAFVVFLVLYLSFYTAVKTIDAVIYKKNRVYQHFIPSLCQAVLFSHLFLLLLFLPHTLRHPLLVWVSGLVLSLLGHTVLCEFLATKIRNPKVSQAFRRIMVTLPWVSGLSFPYRLMEGIESSTRDEPSPQSDVEILFSFGKYGQGIAGHCELCLNGKTYTFGNYDPSSRRILQTMGNGILFCADRDAHIEWLTQNNRTVVAYGLCPDAKQQDKIEESVRRLLDNSERWDVPQAPKEYIYQVQQAFSPDIYRICRGQFATYFLPTINCVTLTCHLLHSTAAGHIFIPGLRTPGTYMDALHRLYLAENTIVSYVKTYEKKK